MIEDQAVTRERGREEYKYVNYEPVVCEPYPFASATYERRWFSRALLRVNHPVRNKSYNSHNLVVVVIVAVVLVLFVACKSAFTQQT